MSRDSIVSLLLLLFYTPDKNDVFVHVQNIEETLLFGLT